MKPFVLTLFIIGIAVLTAACSTSAAPTGPSSSALTLSEPSHEFGSIPINGGKVKHRFEVKNTGMEAATITSVYTSCMCTQAEVYDASNMLKGSFGMGGMSQTSANIALPAGQSLFVDAIFDPAAHGPAGVGEIQRTVTVESNSTRTPSLEFNFHAVVTNGMSM